MNCHSTIDRGVAHFSPDSYMTSYLMEISGQCVPPPPIVNPMLRTCGQFATDFSKDEMQKQWKSSKAYLDIEMTHFNVIASLVEMKLRIMGEKQLGQAAFMPPQPEFKKILASPIPFEPWPLPFTFAATFYDLDRIPENSELFNEVIQRKIWSLADKFGISCKSPLTTSMQSLLANDFEYAISLMDMRPYDFCHTLLNLGFHGEILETWDIQVSTDTNAHSSYACLPLRAINDRHGNQYPMHLPLNKYHLLGLNGACLQSKYKYVITPSYTDWLANFSNSFGGVVLTWLGGEETVELVDWSPIAGHSVVYVVNPFTFGGNCDACLRCMRRLFKILEDKGGTMELYLPDEI